MKYFALLLLLLAGGCATHPERNAQSARGDLPGIRWDLNDAPDKPLYLRRGGSERYLIVAKPIAPYQPLTAAEYEGYHIPATAILAAYSWHAGYGDVVYVLRKPAAFEVYRREMDESETSRFPVKKLRTIPL